MYGTVLVALDGSARAERAIRYAEGVAAPDGRIVLVRVVEPASLLPSSGSADFATLRDPQRLTAHLRQALDRPRVEAAAYLERAQHKVTRTDVTVVTRVLEGAPVERLIEAAGDANLLVLTAHGRTGLRRLLLGSVAERVARRAPVPVLVVRERRQGGSELRSELRDDQLVTVPSEETVSTADRPVVVVK